MQISISDHFSFKKIFRFTLSPILNMVFTSLYGIVDGFFIANFAGLDEYAGVNVIMPVIMIIGGLGFMFGCGGSALAGKYLGEQNKKRANEVFTMIVKVSAIVGIFVSILGFFLIKPIATALGSINGTATDNMVNEAIKYGKFLAAGQVFYILQNVFQLFLVLDGKPKLGFKYILFAGCTNMILDFLFIGVFHWGVIGAAIATILGCFVGTLLPFIYFLKHKEGDVFFIKSKIEMKPILRCCYNGSSEFVNNIASSIIGIIFNIQLLRYYGQAGVTVYGTLMYVGFIFFAIFIGYSVGMAPVISYNYGAKNKIELNSVLKKSLIIIFGLSIIMFLVSEFFGTSFAKIYVGNNEQLIELTSLAFRIFSISFIFCGFSVFFSSFFTALNNGLISALISFLRTLVIQAITVFIFPLIFGPVGIWWSVVAAEFGSCILSFIFLFANNKKYGYFLNKRT